ncbi:hypothetical protein Q4Q34_14250 [Flavivirga abyssicola]|uniref:hypothetical protein n=1 Tax=Flavivirga abyssicola TaxID=3063533 RepID=UPI0026E017CD|nr:hypothetical protein [Flavivirga sp. MEBiC07777]WVK12384.1 hypothetical protein Q4Q34_14250 [Flavivirga sp. MEBiC07777]
MKNFRFVIIFLILLPSCSSVKLLDYWKSSDFEKTLDNRILVIAKNSDFEVRKSYETAIARKLRSHGMDVIEMCETFPSIIENENRTQEDVDMILKAFEKEGVNGIVLMSLKNTIETKNSDYDISKDYNEKSSFELMSDSGAKNLPIMSELKSTTYVLEALTYDLTLKNDNQLVNVCLIDVTDPKSGSKILKSFSKIVGDQFKSK